MNRPTQPHSFFNTPVWPRASFKKSRQRSSSSTSSSSSSSSSPSSISADEREPSRRSAESLPQTTQWTPVNPPAPPPQLSPGALPPGESAPPDDLLDPFHRPAIVRRGRHKKQQTALLAAYNLLPVPTAPWTLRKKHLAVITTILYRCLLERDWPRAERAFACLIRGKDVDIRAVWGVGLELLLRRAPGGVKDAVEYLERLILFFPYRPRLHSHHPALERQPEDEQEEGEGEGEGREEEGNEGDGKGKRRKRKKVVAGKKTKGESTKKRLPPYHSAIEFQPALFSLLIEASKWRDVGKVDARRDDGEEQEQLGDVTKPEKIKERLEELMLTPPWSDLGSLLCLRGMVCMWMADLELRKITEGEGADVEDGEGVSAGIAAEAQRRARELREEARIDFDGLRERGVQLPDGLEEALAAEEEEEDLLDADD